MPDITAQNAEILALGAESGLRSRGRCDEYCGSTQLPDAAVRQRSFRGTATRSPCSTRMGSAPPAGSAGVARPSEMIFVTYR